MGFAQPFLSCDTVIALRIQLSDGYFSLRRHTVVVSTQIFGFPHLTIWIQSLLFQENLLLDEHQDLKLIDFGLASKPMVSQQIKTCEAMSLSIYFMKCYTNSQLLNYHLYKIRSTLFRVCNLNWIYSFGL